MECRVDLLEEKLNDVQQRDKNKNAVIVGLRVQTYSSATRANGDADVKEMESQSRSEKSASIKAFLDLAGKLEVDIDPSEIESIFQLPKKNASSPPVTIVRFNNTLAKKRLVNGKKSMKPTHPKAKEFGNIFINEDLTKVNQELFRDARQLKKQNKVEGAWTRDGKIYIKKKEGPIVNIKRKEQLTIYNE